MMGRSRDDDREEARMSLLRRVIGGVLRRIRLRQGRTLREVAAAAGVSLPYLSEVERGRKEASSEVLAAICRALGIHLSDLLEQARDELRRMERRVPAGVGTAPDRVPVARHEVPGPRLRIGFHPDGELPVVDDAVPVGGAGRHPVGTVDRWASVGFGGHPPVGGLLVAGSTGHLGSTVGGAGLRVRLIASVPAERRRPRTSGAAARRRARRGRRRLTVG
jgi:transcriptional regulator with XRE-family HTH domain